MLTRQLRRAVQTGLRLFMKVHRMKAFSFIRSSLAGGCYQGPPLPKPEESLSGFIPKVPSLLFDLELEDGNTALTESQEDAGAPALAAYVRSLTEPRSDDECQLASHMQLVERLLSDSSDRQGLDVYEVAEGLRKLGHAVTIRNALGGGGGNECLRNLRHRFLTCRMQGAQGQSNFVVDPCFKEQFEIAHVTPRYACILAEVPAAFIGTEEQIIALVEVMSKEISLAFQQSGATLPPWRHTASMLSKWQPRKSEDVSFDAQTMDNRAPSLPQDLPRAGLRSYMGAAKLGHLQRHSTSNAWPVRQPGAMVRVSLDDRNYKGRTSLDESSRKCISDSPKGPVLVSCTGVQPAGVVATVQQSINAIGRKASFNSINHAVHLV